MAVIGIFVYYAAIVLVVTILYVGGLLLIVRRKTDGSLDPIGVALLYIVFVSSVIAIERMLL